jgi:L-ascorbate metabolism protein UlaG (beta-lactamase superfamily)
MRLRLIRNATLRLEYASRSLLVDPSLDPALAWDPIEGILHDGRNPLRELPEPAERVAADLDGVLLSHLHIDHWDEGARRLLPANVPIACRSEAAGDLMASGFVNLHLTTATPGQWLGIELAATSGHHSNGPSRALLDPVSGFVLRAAGEPSLWVAGDSVWCPELESELAAHRPQVIVVNAGAARQLDGELITMDAADVIRVLEAAPDAVVVAVHMEAIGHCTLSRAELREALADYGERLLTPADGETVTFG